MIIRDFQPNDLDQVMKIWLEGNLNAHPFVDRKYWINNFEMVRDALQQSEIIVIEDKLQNAIYKKYGIGDLTEEELNLIKNVDMGWEVNF